ncbi:MAG: hypothetical protein KC486_28535 [Myxococcales bacterium]|nr:hypothetical protein [Myxococcales bacterium]
MRGHCQRCAREVSASYKQPALRRWVKVYFLLGAPFIPLLPIIGSDFAVMLPLTMVYLIGLGPALAVIRAPAFCDDCGAFIETPRSSAQA